MARGMVAENIKVCRCVRKLGDDFPDVVDEAHIEHAVGLVENETFNVVQAERIALDQIEQPAGRGDQDIDAIEQRANLAAHRHAADRQRAFDAQMTAVGAEAVEDLAGQFAGRAEHQDAAALAHRRPRIGGETMQDRQREGGGLAGSGLGYSDQVAARHDGRDRLRLDRGWREVFFFGKRTRDGVVKLKVVKGGQRRYFLLCALARPRRDAPSLRCG